MQRPCSHKDISNQRTTSSGDRRSEECRSGDGHLEWPPSIMEFIHSRNVFQKEVITFNRLWEEEEARLIRRKEKMEENEDQALTFQRRYLKQWGIWITQLLKNLLYALAFDKKQCYYEWRRWWSRRLKKEFTHETNKDKYSIVISWYCFCYEFVYIQLMYYAWQNVCINDNILLICMWWVSSSWCYTALHCYLSRMKSLAANILD